MPQPPKDVAALKESIGQLGRSAPVVTVGEGLAKVGEHVQRGYETVKRKMGEWTGGKKPVAKKATSAGKRMSGKR